MPMLLASLVSSLLVFAPNGNIRAASRQPLISALLRASATDPTDTALQALSLPAQPSPDLDASDVCLAICRGLQHVDVPTKDRGFERLFYFATYECRAVCCRPHTCSGCAQLAVMLDCSLGRH